MSNIAIMLILFFVLLALNVPIAISIGVPAIIYIIQTGVFQLTYVPSNMFTACDSFPLMAIPLFILAGNLMQGGGLSKRLIDFADSLVGHFTGGLAIVMVLACAFFGAISGSSAATVATIGGILVPSMLERGYSKKFTYGLITAAGCLGVLVPPSIPMVLYGGVTNTSIATMFMGGFGVAVVCAACLIVVSVAIAARKGFKGNGRKFSIAYVGKTFKTALGAIGVVIIILGGIYSGIFTPTEAAAVTCVYSFIVGKWGYKELTWKGAWQAVTSSAVTTSTILLIMGTASALARVLTIERIPVILAEAIANVAHSPAAVLLIMNIFLLIVGCVMDGTPACLILAPILQPIAASYGVDPVHFGLMMILNLAIGFITPPVGLNLYVSCSLGDVKFVEVIKGLVPFLLAMIAALLIVTYVPGVSLAIPRLFGYGG